jgi:glycosyltransferase involved in cell wall biosynthesis
LLGYSVVIPSLGRETLKHAISSCVNQSVKPEEVLVVHNRPLDSIKVSDLPKGVRVVSSHSADKVVSWAARNRNIGVRESKSSLIAFLDDDDVWLPKKMELQIAHMQKFRLDFSATGSIYRQSCPRIEVSRPNIFYQSDQGSVFSHFYGSSNILRSSAYIPTPSFLVRRHVAMAEPFNENYPYFEDIEWLQRLYAVGYKMEQLPDPLVLVSGNPWRSSKRQSFDVNKRWVERISSENPSFGLNFIKSVALKGALFKMSPVDLAKYLRLLVTYKHG